MDKHQLYINTLCSLFLITVVGLAALKEQRLEVYSSLFTVSYFASSALFRPRRRWCDVVGAVLLLVFGYIVVIKVIEVLI